MISLLFTNHFNFYYDIYSPGAYLILYIVTVLWEQYIESFLGLIYHFTEKLVVIFLVQFGTKTEF